MINANEHFEIVGELYERRFHKLRPGKSVSPMAGYSSMDDDNVQQFKRWIDAQSWDDAIAEISRLQAKVKVLEEADDQIVALVSAMKRADPEWCESHGETQIDDESWDAVLAAGEDYIEERFAPAKKP